VKQRKKLPPDKQIELTLIGEDRFFSSYVKFCREHFSPQLVEQVPALHRRHDPKTKRASFRVVCPICKRETVWVDTQRKAIATWNMIITLTSKKL
jgi:C4-type Zn-finger protein